MLGHLGKNLGKTRVRARTPCDAKNARTVKTIPLLPARICQLFLRAPQSARSFGEQINENFSFSQLDKSPARKWALSARTLRERPHTLPRPNPARSHVSRKSPGFSRLRKFALTGNGRRTRPYGCRRGMWRIASQTWRGSNAGYIPVQSVQFRWQCGNVTPSERPKPCSDKSLLRRSNIANVAMLLGIVAMLLDPRGICPCGLPASL